MNQHLLTWQTLFSNQYKLLIGKTYEQFYANLDTLGLKENVFPDLEEISENLHNETGWRLHFGKGFIPATKYFEFLRKGKFPINVNIRSFDHLVHAKVPDLFHDLFGHLHLLCIPEYNNFIDLISCLALEYIDDKKMVDLISKFNKWTTEFGLIRSIDNKLKVYGAGLISSKQEIKYVMNNTHLVNDACVFTMLNTTFVPASLQQNYFVIDSFEWLTNSVEVLIKELHDINKRNKASPVLTTNS